MITLTDIHAADIQELIFALWDARKSDLSDEEYDEQFSEVKNACTVLGGINVREKERARRQGIANAHKPGETPAFGIQGEGS